MPALSDMRELLHIPFFLTRTVELFENGRLEGLRDVGELLERLVDFALTREEELAARWSGSQRRGPGCAASRWPPRSPAGARSRSPSYGRCRWPRSSPAT